MRERPRDAHLVRDIGSGAGLFLVIVAGLAAAMLVLLILS